MNAIIKPVVHRYHAAHPTGRAVGGPEPLPPPGPPARFPLAISADRRRLLDADGRPFLIVGDACWSIIANLTLDEAIHYLDDRRAKGFNTLLVNLIEHLFSKDPPRDRAGREPFLTKGDMATPNDAYFDAAAKVLDAAAERGFAVILSPCYIGYKHDRGAGISPHFDGWYDEIVASGPDKCRAYGEYLGRRFSGYANIIWSMGGDWHPEEALPGLHAIARGIRSAGVKTPFTAHPAPEFSPVESFPGAEWLDLNLTYTYGTVPRALLDDWKRKPVMPFFLVESTYEGEHNASEQQIRRQAYWSVLCGGNGHVFGNHPIWLFWDGWEEALDLPGSFAMARWAAYFRGLPWAELAPDLEQKFVFGGLGERRGLDTVTAAVTGDGSLGAVYLPVARPIAVRLGALKGPRLAAEWFEPATGRRLSGGILAAEGEVTLAPPFREDAMLTLTSCP